MVVRATTVGEGVGVGEDLVLVVFCLFFLLPFDGVLLRGVAFFLGVAFFFGVIFCLPLDDAFLFLGGILM